MAGWAEAMAAMISSRGVWIRAGREAGAEEEGELSFYTAEAEVWGGEDGGVGDVPGTGHGGADGCGAGRGGADFPAAGLARFRVVGL